ncbi:MAG TPA: GNAT family N-acetyltransferase [Clostridia bacterium]|nr:GNAT family N-acetyltransferase [Clostridia bacterium]
MRKSEFVSTKELLPSFKHTSLDHVVYESVEQYQTLQNDPHAIFLYGENKEAEVHEIHFAVNDVQLLIDQIKSLPSTTLVTMIPPEHKSTFIRQGFAIYGELQDYWIDPLGAQMADISDICFLEKREYAVASEVTKSVKGQSREFHGESEEWVEAWVNGEEPNAKDCGSTDCNVIVHRNHGAVVGVVCVAIYGHHSSKGAVLWIREIAVRPEAQGRGIGRKLLDQALRYGISKGAKRAFLMADNCNHNAIKLYTDAGFVGKYDGAQVDMIYERLNESNL